MCAIFAYINYLSPKNRSEIIGTLLQGLSKIRCSGCDSIAYTRFHFGVVHKGNVTNTTEIESTWGQFDTDLISELIQRLYEQNPHCSLYELLGYTKLMKGSYALMIKHNLFLGKFAATRHGLVPLFVGIKTTWKPSSVPVFYYREAAYRPRLGNMSMTQSSSQSSWNPANSPVEYFVASELSAVIDHTQYVVVLKDGDVVYVEDGALCIYRIESSEGSSATQTEQTLERHNSVFFGGILGSLFSVLQFLSSPVFGSLSDLHGRKPLLLVAVLGSLGSYCLWSLSSDSFSLFFLSRLLGGLSKASVSVAIAIVTDLMPTEQRGKGMAFVGGSFSLAFLIGPSIGAFFSIGARASAEFDPSPARLAMALTLAELALLLFLLPETLPRAKKRNRNREKKWNRDNNLSLYTGLLLYSVASATVVPFLTTLFSQQCEESQKGVCLGAFRSIGALARACGPLVGSLLFWLLGPTLSYGIGAVGLIVPAIMFYRIRQWSLMERIKEE
uniref:MFS domain-containing protein n=1 Tax=Globodera pallida TaxID=36090 RepID=A0A183BJI6_GLOPA